MSGPGSDPLGASELRIRLARGPALLLDGATGTELERRGHDTSLPLWSARALLEAPDALARIHADHAAAGAEILTADTFRTQRRTLARAGGEELAGRDAELCALAVALARRGGEAGTRRVFVAGSAPPLEDCYRPDLVPPDAALAAEHARHAENLRAAGADLILVETMNACREARAAARAARATGLPFVVSFVCRAGAELLSGEPLAEAIEQVSTLGPDAVAVNCLPPREVGACLSVLRASGLPFGVWANLGAPVDNGSGRRTDECTPRRFAAHARGWLVAGARIVGGCCGTTPEHVRAMADELFRT